MKVLWYISQVRILTTHGLTHLAHCDLIVVMDGGRIVEQGSYSELIANNGTFAELLHTYANMERKGIIDRHTCSWIISEYSLHKTCWSLQCVSYYMKVHA